MTSGLADLQKSTGSPCLCERCGDALDADAAVWLELDTMTGRYLAPGATPQLSQGFFAFGDACAAKVLANGGENEMIRRKGRNTTRPARP
jgi:hypothetical protein